jgi:hypothetical protein
MNNKKSPIGDNFRYLIEERIKNFWGYGSLEATTWFVGMEEGLDANATQEQLIARFKSAHGKVTVDMRRDMQEVKDHIRWFCPNPPIQQSWKYPIALFLYLKNKRMPTKEEIRKYQSESVGDDILKETVAIELMPLPSNKAHQSSWKYGDVDVVGLTTRDEYLKTHKPARVKKLTELLKKHGPKYVIFYSLTYLKEWTDVIGVTPTEVTKGMYIAKVDNTLCCIIPQGAYPGMSYERIHELAEKVLEHSK